MGCVVGQRRVREEGVRRAVRVAGRFQSSDTEGLVAAELSGSG